MEGHTDPFNRRTYPWGREDFGLLNHFRVLGKLRKNLPSLRFGNIRFFQAGDGKIGFYRGDSAKIYVNQSTGTWDIPMKNVLFSHHLQGRALAPGGFCIGEEEKEE